jgi:serine/threonine protein kinase
MSEPHCVWEPGAHIGAYRLVSLIGRGGSGEVWKARDERLQRFVAIKRLKQAHEVRFREEARNIASLNHPHICQIFDVGEDYLVLEYVEGGPIAGPLPPPDVLRLGAQIADGLEAAHRGGVIHRDLKPSNILLSNSGSIKVVDFGLAKPVRITDSDRTQTMTGTVLGTIPYMSPEQVRGETLDQRSDIFSLGAVLYEMACGRRAFMGGSTGEVWSAILRDDPPALARQDIQNVVAQCLQKLRDKRFVSAAEVRDRLSAAAASRTCEAVPAIAVLPFDNNSRDGDSDYFSDGLADDIANKLALLPGLRVTARTSAFAFRHRQQDIREIARQLNVNTILEGSVQRSGDVIRVRAQLINAENGFRIWSGQFDRRMEDVFAVQDEITAEIVKLLRVTLAVSPPPRETENIAAYEAWLKGRHHLLKHTPEGLDRSRRFFEEAIALDPAYAAPHISLARYYLGFAVEGLKPSTEMLPLVRREATAALQINARDRRAKALLGVSALILDYDWRRAQELFEEPEVPPPGSPEVDQSYAFYLAAAGRYREACAILRRILEIDPLNVAVRARLGNDLNLAEEYDEALIEVSRGLDTGEDYWLLHYVKAENLLLRGRLEEARAPAERAYDLAPWNARVLGLLAGIVTKAAGTGCPEELGQKLRKAAPAAFMFYDLVASETSAAAVSFRRAVEAHEAFALMYAHSPLTARLRASEEWRALAASMVSLSK